MIERVGREQGEALRRFGSATLERLPHLRRLCNEFFAGWIERGEADLIRRMIELLGGVDTEESLLRPKNRARSWTHYGEAIFVLRPA